MPQPCPPAYARRPLRISSRWLLACFALAAAACGSSRTPAAAAPQLSPAETFDWSGQAITFAPPSAGWRREGETSGGIKGARFVKERSVGEAIGLGDYYVLADRHRRVQLREMLDRFETYDDGFAWDKAIRGAYAHTDTPFTPLESEIAERINTEIGQANVAFRTHDQSAARSHLEAALTEAERLHFTLDEVVDRVEFTPERRQEPERYHVLGRREATLAGEPAVIIDYTVTTAERTMTAREAYFVHNSHLFIATFIGLPENLALFDAVLASIRFAE